MKNVLFAAMMLLFASCDKSTTTVVTPVPPTPPPAAVVKSSFDITFNGHTYTVVDTAGSVNVQTSTTGTSDGVIVLANGTQISMNFSAIKDSAVGIRTGCYRSGTSNIKVLGLLDLYDKEDGNKHYASDQTGADTTSVIIVTTATSTQVQGTFSVTLSWGGHYYPATGHFDYNK